jgi:hypothetical protein
MTPEHEPLSTAQLARATEEIRGRSDEDVVNRAARTSSDIPDRNRTAANEAVAAAPAPAIEHDNGKRDVPALFAANDATALRNRWVDVQTAFVDEPRTAVQNADSLVAEVMKRLAETFANERATLEHQWDRGDNVTTEDLRIALQRYRTFFDRLLSI